MAQRKGLLEPLAEFGGRVSVDTCILVSPMLSPSVKRIMTNSAKYAYYAPGILNTSVVFGGLEECVESAEQGRVVVDHKLWQP